MTHKTAFNWQGNCIYHIFIKSFGNFTIIKDKLSYIKDLGCNIIWLSPFFDCYNKNLSMHGYDVINFYKVNPLFSEKKNYIDAEKDLKSLLNKAHALGMKVLFDFVPNHTSIFHSWFTDKKIAQEFYILSETCNPKDLNNYGYNAWNYSSIHEQFYYSYFSPDLADLNYKNPNLQIIIINIIMHWLDFGFDGVRIDAARYIFKNKIDSKQTHNFYRKLKSVIIEKFKDSKILLGEVWVNNDRKILNSYFGTTKNPEFDIILDFDQGWRCTSSLKNETDNIKDTLYSNPTSKKSYAVFLNNHDSYYNRIGTELYNNFDKIKLTLALNILRPNIPVIYYGTEIGLANNTNQDGYDLYRGAMPWDVVSEQISSSYSVLNFTKLLISFRNQHSALFSCGSINKFKSQEYYDCGIPKENLIAYIITSKTEEILIVYNISSDDIDNFEMSSSYLFQNGQKYKKIFSYKETSVKFEANQNRINFTNLPGLSFSVFKIVQ